MLQLPLSHTEFVQLRVGGNPGFRGANLAIISNLAGNCPIREHQLFRTVTEVERHQSALGLGEEWMVLLSTSHRANVLFTSLSEFRRFDQLRSFTRWQPEQAQLS
jgi:hypothetical protein